MSKSLKGLFHRDPKPTYAAGERNVSATVLSATKATLGVTSQALGLLPTPIPKTVSDILLQLITQIEVISIISSAPNLSQLKLRVANCQ